MEQPERHISLGHVEIGDLGKQFIQEVLSSNRLSHGKYIHAFETEFAALHGRRAAIFCNSGASALIVALAALKEREQWRAGDEVLVPAITYVATANAVLHNQLRPVFVDVKSDHYTIDPRRIKAKITGRTRAIIPSHLFGLPCEMNDISPLAREHGLRVIEDASQAMFARDRGVPVGSAGDLACFSTDAGQLLSTGVGGLITTNDPEMALICRSLISQGRDAIYLTIDDDDDLREEARRCRIIERRFAYERLGYSFRLTELEGALGLAQLAERDRRLQRRRENAERLTELLAPFSAALQRPETPPHCERPFTVYPIVVRDAAYRAPLLDFLEARGIETRYMLPLLSQPAYRRLFGSLENRYPVANWLNQCGFFIGCHPGLTPDDLAYVARQFAAFFAEHVRPDDAA